MTKAAVQPNDAQLVAASRFDGVHFVTVFDRHAASVHAYLARRLGDAAGAAHLGDAFSAAYGARRHFRAFGDSARPWLLGVATGVVRRQWRLEQRRLRACADRPDVIGAAALAEHLQHLPARDRDVLLLAAWEDQEPVAVAAALDLPDGAVVARMTGLAGDLSLVAPRPGELAEGCPDAGIARLRSLRPDSPMLDPDQAASARRDLEVLTGRSVRVGVRSTVSVAAEHEQHRRWSVRPGLSLVHRNRH